MQRVVTVDDVIALAEETHVKFVRLQITDILGALKNVAITVEELERALAGRVLFDSAIIEGHIRGRARDILLQPDPSTFEIFPWRPRDGAVARLICEARNPDGTPFEACSRLVLRRAAAALREAGLELTVGAEIEFFLLHGDGQGQPRLETHDRAGYCDLSPVDLGENARRDMVLTLEEMGIEVMSSHHEEAPGQHEIGLKDDTVVAIADKIATFKFVVRTVAQRHGLHASFMPKPLPGRSGSGLTLKLSLWRETENLFTVQDGKLSTAARHFMGGLIRHSGALTALTNPLVNSYKRMVPGQLSPYLAAWSRDNRSTMLRVPTQPDESVRLLLRSPDPAANPYLALAAIVAAGLDGIEGQIEPEPFINDEVVGETDSPALRTRLKKDGLPRNLQNALQALEGDELISGVLGEEVVQRYLRHKENEWSEFESEIHTWEIEKYLANY
ncbi:MAG: glutamine synthetase family protein [Clostridia bacterium]|nr:glutamine synthetase family protein [Clostridia bacterium]MDQ7791341.1 glutamine synthetase family protein [Clostridia bacterium]